MAREIAAAQASLADITGEAPRFFRAPAGLRNPFLAPVLQRLDLQLVSWTRRGFDTVRREPTDVLARLARGLAAGDILLAHDGNAARAEDGRAVVLAVLPELLARAKSLGLVAVTLPAASLQQRSDDAAAPAEARSERIAMSSADAAVEFRALVAAASEPYQRAGKFAWHFARGKLRWDPVFSHLLARGLIAPRTRVLDIGCGQGLLASLLAAAAQAAREGRWPSDWAEAPIDVRVSGIDLLERDVERARHALGDGIDIVCGDMRTTAFAAVDAVVILDVLHYVGIADQDAVLARVRAALPIGGRLVMRIGDASARRGFVASEWVDRFVKLARGQGFGRQTGRTLAAWQARLAELGFAVTSEPMHRGTPFANILLFATVERAPSAPGTSA